MITNYPKAHKRFQTKDESILKSFQFYLHGDGDECPAYFSAKVSILTLQLFKIWYS